MTVLQKILAIGMMFAAVGMVFYEAHQAAVLRGQVQMLQRQQAVLSNEIRQLHDEKIDAAISKGTVTGILADPKFRMVVHALAQRDGFEELAEPEAVTISGRGENRMRIGDMTINLIPPATSP